MKKSECISIVEIQRQIAKELPGQKYQNLMSPISIDKYRIVPKEHKIACVMALLHHKKEGSLYVTFIQRASKHPKDKHAGQIGFPGGKLEYDDPSLEYCALREVEEEIGVRAENVTMLGKLTPLYVYASNFLVHPYVGFIEEPPQYTLQTEEVDDVIELPITFLVDEGNKTHRSVGLSNGQKLKAPGYDLKNHFLWGATAMITSELEELVRRVR